jgi:hypothetical protein
MGSAIRPWEESFQGIAADSFVSYPLSGTLKEPPHPDLEALDPYGVTGTWMRIVCFLDYNDLYAFNFESGYVPPDTEREPISTREAFRLIRLQLQVVAIEDPGDDDGKDLPVVHFEGTSRSTFMAWDPNANSRIRGKHCPLWFLSPSLAFPPTNTQKEPSAKPAAAPSAGPPSASSTARSVGAARACRSAA